MHFFLPRALRKTPGQRFGWFWWLCAVGCLVRKPSSLCCVISHAGVSHDLNVWSYAGTCRLARVEVTKGHSSAKPTSQPPVGFSVNQRHNSMFTTATCY